VTTKVATDPGKSKEGRQCLATLRVERKIGSAMKPTMFILISAGLAYTGDRFSEVPPDAKNADDSPQEAGRIDIVQFASTGSMTVTSGSSTLTAY
jgi:hypothetical protein